MPQRPSCPYGATDPSCVGTWYLQPKDIVEVRHAGRSGDTWHARCALPSPDSEAASPISRTPPKKRVRKAKDPRSSNRTSDDHAMVPANTSTFSPVLHVITQSGMWSAVVWIEGGDQDSRRGRTQADRAQFGHRRVPANNFKENAFCEISSSLPLGYSHKSGSPFI